MLHVSVQQNKKCLQIRNKKSVSPLRTHRWSEWRDLNSRPLDPQSSALPTALHPDILFCCASRGQLVYINMTVMKLQPLISIFLKFFCKRDSMKTCWQSPQLYGIISKVFRRRTAFTMERCPSGWRNRSWKPATCKRPWVRIPLSPPNFLLLFPDNCIRRSTQEAEGAPLLRE